MVPSPARLRVREAGDHRDPTGGPGTEVRQTHSRVGKLSHSRPFEAREAPRQPQLLVAMWAAEQRVSVYQPTGPILVHNATCTTCRRGGGSVRVRFVTGGRPDGPGVQTPTSVHVLRGFGLYTRASAFSALHRWCWPPRDGRAASVAPTSAGQPAVMRPSELRPTCGGRPAGDCQCRRGACLCRAMRCVPSSR